MDKTEKRKHFSIMKILYIVYLFLLAVTVAAVVFSATAGNSYTEPERYLPYDSGWTDESGTPADLEKLTGTTAIVKRLPVIEQDCELFFRVKNLNVAVYKDNILYKDYGEAYSGMNAGYKCPGTYFVMIPLYREDSGSELRITIENPYQNDSSCNIKSMYLGQGYAIIQAKVFEMLPGFCTSVLIILIGGILGLLSVTLKKYNRNNSSLLSLGLFAFVIGIWSATETKLLHLLIGYTSIIHLVTSLSLILIAVPIFLFFRARKEATDKISAILVSVLTVIGFLISVIMHFAGIRDLHENITIAHIVIITGCLFTLYYAFQVFRKSHFRDFAFWGLLIIAVFSIVDIVLYYKQITTDNSTFVRFGVLGYVTLLAAQLLEGYVRTYSENVKADMLLQMAYSDVLTGFYNRNSFISDIKEIDRSLGGHKGRAVLVFDLNCLKYINDTMGHTMGDTALKEAAGYIKQSFSSIGKCYRIGGDEYTVISDKALSEPELDGLYQGFQAHILNRNNAPHDDRPYPLYIAFGYDVIGGSAESAMDTFNSADAKMYENKQKLKEILKSENAAYVR